MYIHIHVSENKTKNKKRQYTHHLFSPKPIAHKLKRETNKNKGEVLCDVHASVNLQTKRNKMEE